MPKPLETFAEISVNKMHPTSQQTLSLIKKFEETGSFPGNKCESPIHDRTGRPLVWAVFLDFKTFHEINWIFGNLSGHKK